MATFAGLTTTGWLHSYTYSDGLGRELQTKVQAENGKAWVMQNGVPVQIDDITDRFVATGRKIYNNKGNVIKQYEPWFSDGHLYEPEAELTQYGVTPIMHYDAPGRLIKTEFPDGTLSRVEFDAWQQKTFDRNDCVNGSQWLATMQQGTTAQQRAATLAQAHNNTPQVTDIDTMGRPYRITDDAGNGVYCTTVNHNDIAGLPIMVTDAMAVPRDMTRHVYDMTGQLCYTFNIDSGRRWMVVNALDKPLHTWDNLLRKTTLQYDALNRPVTTLLYNNNTTDLKVESITYGTSATGYTIGRPVIIRDQSGKLDLTAYDFKGNMLSSARRLATDYSGIINWNTYADPTGESFVTAFTFDAMNRPVTETTPDGKVRTYEYNKAGLLEKVKLGTVEYVNDINYNEKGQRIDIIYGNNSKTRYDYDPKSFRLTRLLTTRNNGQVVLQDLRYTYDPEGNLVEQTDDAVQTEIFGNTLIPPTGKYEYDALYRLTKAQGREQLNLAMATDTDHLTTGNDMQNYTQLYTYDELGNMQSVNSQGKWTRSYQYDTATNRLLNTGSGYNYTYDAHGNMVSMPHLNTMEWDYKGNLVKTIAGTVTTYYQYDASGIRVRKIAIKAGGISEERIYNGNYEVYRKKIGGNLDTERQSSLVSDATKRIAIVDTRTTPNPVQVTIRYQYDNHLGSACLELDGNGAVISYEEYHPFGTTSYRAGRNATETSLKRYKYVGKERDEETGLYYYGARYYAAWLCRFVSVDPLQFKYPHYTPFQYAGNKPISYIDLDGLEEILPTLQYNTKASGTVDNGTPLKLAENLATGISRFGTGMVNSTLIDIPNTLEYNINYIREKGIGQWASETGKVWSAAILDLASDTKSVLQEPAESQWRAVDDLLNSPVGYDFGASLLFMKIPSLGKDFSALSNPEITIYNHHISTFSKNGLSNDLLIQKAANKAEAAIGGTGRFAGTAIHNYAISLLSRYQKIYGYKGLRFKEYFNNGPGNRGFLDILDKKNNIIYDYKFGYSSKTLLELNNTPQMFRYQRNFGLPTKIVRPE